MMDREAQIKRLYGMDKEADLADGISSWAQENPDAAAAAGYGVGGGLLGYMLRGTDGILPGAAAVGGSRYLLGKLDRHAGSGLSGAAAAAENQAPFDFGSKAADDKMKGIEAAYNMNRLKNTRLYRTAGKFLNKAKPLISKAYDVVSETKTQMDRRKGLIKELLENPAIGPTARAGLNKWIATGNEKSVPWEFRGLVSARAARQAAADRATAWNRAFDRNREIQALEDSRAAARAAAASEYARGTAAVRIPDLQKHETPLWIRLFRH